MEVKTRPGEEREVDERVSRVHVPGWPLKFHLLSLGISPLSLTQCSLRAGRLG